MFGNVARAGTRASPDGDETRYVFMQSHFGHVLVAPFKKGNIHGAEPADYFGGRERERERERQADKQRQTETETDIQRQRQTETEAETEAERQTETDRQRQRKPALPTQFICDVSYNCMFH